MNHETAAHAAMASNQRAYEQPLEEWDCEGDSKYAVYLSDFAQERLDDWHEFLADVERGTTDPMTYEEWSAEEESPQSYEDWCMDMASAAEEQALYERHPEGW